MVANKTYQQKGDRAGMLCESDEFRRLRHAVEKAAGDRERSARWATYVKNLNYSLAALDVRASGAAYNIPGYMAPLPPVPAAQYPYPAAAYPYASYPNATGYGANPYGTSPTSGVMSSLLGPMFGSGQIPSRVRLFLASRRVKDRLRLSPMAPYGALRSSDVVERARARTALSRLLDRAHMRQSRPLVEAVESLDPDRLGELSYTPEVTPWNVSVF